MNDRGGLLILPGASPSSLEPLLETARRHGIDAYRLRMELNGRALACAARGPVARLASAAAALTQAGLRAVVVADDEVHALPTLEVSSGVCLDGDRLALFVHGRPDGPPAGEPLLFVVADLGRVGVHEPSGGSVRQRLLRARLPVVDVVWKGGRVRVSLRGMTWRGLPEHGLSGADNMIRTLGEIAHQAGGTAVDFGFVGQDLGVDLPRATLEPLEGRDSERTRLFDRYAAAAALAWGKDLYPSAPPGEVVPVGDATAAPTGVREARAFFTAPPPKRAAAVLPWIRRGKPSHLRWSPWPWLVGPPLAAFFLAAKFSREREVGILFGFAFLIGGVSSVILGLRSLARRERVRSVPLSRIRSMPMGPVALAGNVVSIVAFQAPYSHAECVWYRVEVREANIDEKANLYRSLDTGSSADVPFRLQDETGSVLIQPADAEVDGEPELFPLDGGMVAVEWTIPAGERVFVSGFAQRRSTDATADAPAVLSDRDDVFVGSAPGVPLSVVLRTRPDEVRALSRSFAWTVAAGAAYILLALFLFLSA